LCSWSTREKTTRNIIRIDHNRIIPFCHVSTDFSWAFEKKKKNKRTTTSRIETTTTTTTTVTVTIRLDDDQREIMFIELIIATAQSFVR
jgi:hypothetical protein